MGLIVLIVDDDEGVRFFHQIIVSQSGLSPAPLCFCNAGQAFDYLDRNCKEADHYLILLDINMPVMNGWDLMDAISKKSYYNQVHIAIVTSSVDKVDQEKAKLYHTIIGVVEKPITVEDCKRIMNLSALADTFNP